MSLIDSCNPSILTSFHIDKIKVIDNVDFDEVLVVLKK